MNKRLATVCSGIGAPEVATLELGWRHIFGADIEPFPNAVRAYRFPEVPNLGDMTKFKKWPKRCDCKRETGTSQNETKLKEFKIGKLKLKIQACNRCGGIGIDVLIAGTPCQAFSVAGLREGLADPRGNLTLVLLGIIDRYRPEWILWENVPGVHSSWSDEASFVAGEESGALVEKALGDIRAAGIDGFADVGTGDFEEVDQSNDFDTFLAGLEQLGYGVATRILDAQYFGVAQRRRRVFVVGHIGGQWQRAASVLFERESLCGNPPPRRETRQRPADQAAGSVGNGSERETSPTLSARTKGGGGLGTDFDCDGGLVHHHELPEKCATLTKNYATHHGRSAGNNGGIAEGQIIPIQEVNKRTGRSTEDKGCGIGIGKIGDKMFTLQKGAQHGVAIGIDSEMNAHEEMAGPLNHLSPSGGGHPPAVAIGIDGGEVGFALRSNPSHSGDKGDGGVNTNMVVHEIAPCIKSNRGMNSDPSMEVQSLVAEHRDVASTIAKRQVADGNDARSGRMRGREGCAGGGKGPLLSVEKSLTLAANANDQVLFQAAEPRPNDSAEPCRDIASTLRACSSTEAGHSAPAGDKDENLVVHSLRGVGFDASEDGTGRGTPLVPEITTIDARNNVDRGDSQHLERRVIQDAPDISNAICQRDYKGERPEADQGAPLIAISGQPAPETDTALGIPGNWIGRKPENGGNATEPMRECSPNLTRSDRHGGQTGMAVRQAWRSGGLRRANVNGCRDSLTISPPSIFAGNRLAMVRDTKPSAILWLYPSSDGSAPGLKWLINWLKP